jgi:hypothetical protein
VTESDYYIKQIRFNSLEECTLLHALARYRKEEEERRFLAGETDCPIKDGATRTIDRIDALLTRIKEGESWEVTKEEFSAFDISREQN